MKSLVSALALVSVLAAGPVHAQQAAAPAAPAPAPAAPAAQAPAAPAQPAAQPRPPVPFPEGAKVGFINVQLIANQSAEGRAATSRVKALNDKKVAELADKQKALAAAQEKLQKGGSVLSDAARVQLEKEIEKLQVEIQRFTQDAQAEVQELQNELQNEFQKKLLPIIDAVAQERGLHMVFSVADAGVVWANPGLDLTPDVIKRFDTVAPPRK
jgi:Skp family chaperone for outer membrane proteins